MAIKLCLFVVFASTLASLLFPTQSSSNDNVLHIKNGIDWWCSKTPYPETCKNSCSEDQKHPVNIPKQKSHFKKLLLRVTMQQALKAQSHNKWLGSKCRSHNELAAWADCLKLYEDTISLLNQTLDPATKCTDFDTQTWLSATLTNLETCRAGSEELGVSGFLLPMMSNINNVSKLISNALSVNKNDSVRPETHGYEQGFPRWLSPGDRKLLQSSSQDPDAVVAQDGSGNFRTIKDALDAAEKRSGSGRFVIQVKRGVYKENLDIGKKLKNIMLVGDGLRYTVITGSRSAGGGSTTFDSATVGNCLSLSLSLPLSLISISF